MTTSTPMIEGRRADSARRRQRVIKAINSASRSGGEISVSAVARAAGVDRTFLYRHTDLLGQVHAAQANPAAGDGGCSAVSRNSLQADLANAHGQITRQAARVRLLEKKLSELLGKPGANRALALPPTSINSSAASPNWNNRSLTCKANSTNATRN